MAGFNNMNKKNFFSDNIKKSGEGFLESMDAKMLRRAAKRVFSDISRGNIDYDKYWTYFTNNMFIDALVDVANTNCLIHTNDYNAHCVARQYVGISADTEAIIRYHKRLSEAYALLYNAFNMIKYNGYQVDIAMLKTLTSQLRDYSHDMNEPMFSSNAVPPEAVMKQPQLPPYIDLMKPVEQTNNEEPQYVKLQFTRKPSK